MKILRSAVVLSVLVFLSACSAIESFNAVDDLNDAQAAGSPFTRALAAEYKDFANSELHRMFDFSDALHFARKGLAAASGEVVPPEPIEDWNLRPEFVPILGEARARLVSALDAGGRDRAPEVAARAQVSFDCWIEQQEENHQPHDIAACRGSFESSIVELERLIAPPPMVEAPIVEPIAPKDAMYLVFFDWNSAKLDDGGRAVLGAVSTEIARSKPPVVRVVGHTDTSGDKTYNQRLGLRRAVSVRDDLVTRGVEARLIATESRGQEDLMVQTGDNVREPANRRANISFQ